MWDLSQPRGDSMWDLSAERRQYVRPQSAERRQYVRPVSREETVSETCQPRGDSMWDLSQPRGDSMWVLSQPRGDSMWDLSRLPVKTGVASGNQCKLLERYQPWTAAPSFCRPGHGHRVESSRYGTSVWGMSSFGFPPAFLVGLSPRMGINILYRFLLLSLFTSTGFLFVCLFELCNNRTVSLWMRIANAGLTPNQRASNAQSKSTAKQSRHDIQAPDIDFFWVVVVVLGDGYVSVYVCVSNVSPPPPTPPATPKSTHVRCLCFLSFLEGWGWGLGGVFHSFMVCLFPPPPN